MNHEITRRRFLHGSGAFLLTLSMARLRASAAAPSEATASTAPGTLAYRGWEDVYRERWTWDRIAKGTHYINCWYQRGCSWNIYVKDGIVWREEQTGAYDQTNSDVPDFNPRGCQKGACYSQRMYDAGRLRVPLKRVGERGSGSWKRISWEQALDEIADSMIDALVEDGSGSIMWDPGTQGSGGGAGMGTYRAGFLLDTPVMDLNSETGDHHPGAMATVGKISFASSADDLFYSDLILIWGGNPVYTQIPNAHFINEARYHGAHVVTIAPDFNASAVHADEWLPVNVGTDAALGLGLAYVLIEENLYDTAFVREQTDLPLLVRTDTGRFLRESDVVSGGADNAFFVFDEGIRELRKVNPRTLALEGAVPVLEGRFPVSTPDGSIHVEPVFARLRRHLMSYTPERVQALTGTNADEVRILARRIAKARAATFLTQANFSKFYHGLEMERAQILVLTLAGQIGKKGSGITGFAALVIAGTEAVNITGSASGGAETADAAATADPLAAFREARARGLTDEMILYEQAREHYRRGNLIAGALYFNEVGLRDLYSGSEKWDPDLKRPLRSYFDEAVRNGWQIPPTPARPRVYVSIGGNMLRRTRGYHALHDTLLRELDCLVALDWRMNNTGLHADYVLPAAGWYEKDDITYATPIAPFCHPTTRAVEPIAEAKTDWAFHCLLMKAMQARARAREVKGFRDRSGVERDLTHIYDIYTFQGRYTERDDVKLLDELLRLTTNLGGMRWDELSSKGFERYTGLGLDLVNIGNATDIRPGETITSNTWHTEKKMPWPTLTRRIQFYIDHPFYMELGEELPVHKDPPKIGGDHPLQMTGGHARWSIHASWRDEPNLLRLQRGEPVMIMNPRDAGERGLEDGEFARVWNDVGSMTIQVKTSASLRPTQVVVYHAWEPFQFRGRTSHQALLPNPINPVQLAGGYFHLQPLIHQAQPGGNDRGVRVEVERIGPAAPATQAHGTHSGG
jgi:DMSO reductase family type II enzyme molybdopterin subunit